METFGAVLIEGPKWTGKTTTAEQQAKSVIKLQDPNKVDEYLVTATIKPSLLLKGEQPRLIDEWQDAPMLWDAVRTAVDNAGGVPGQYILTGSNTVDKHKIRHIGTGRITRMKMFPMSLWESLESSGEVSIHELFDNPDYDIDGALSKLDIPDLIRVACRGGWPATLQMKSKTGMLVAKDYVNSVCENDINSHISYYRDRYGLEADLVLHLEDERYALIECKLGSREIEDGAKHLLEIKRLVQEHNKTEKQVPLREPDLLIVLTGGSMAYTRPDGVKVIPLACLKD